MGLWAPFPLLHLTWKDRIDPQWGMGWGGGVHPFSAETLPVVLKAVLKPAHSFRAQREPRHSVATTFEGLCKAQESLV